MRPAPGDALALKRRKYKPPGDLHAGETDFNAAWQGVVAEARKARPKVTVPAALGVAVVLLARGRILPRQQGRTGRTRVRCHSGR
jgi:hypothetical protein